MKNKRIVLLLAFVMVMTTILAACGGTKPAETKPAETTETTETATTEPATTEEPEVTKFADSETLVVSGSELNGSYINGFGNSTYDVWIKRLIGNYDGDLGYATTYYDEAGEFHVNPTVVNGEITSVENADGTKTFTTQINEGLVWNDGTPITAKDYVFSVLWLASPEWMITGATNATAAEDYVGFDEFHEGTSQELTGIKLVDEYTFEQTLKADKVPYFYETTLISVSPRPLHRYAPNMDVVGSALVVKEGYEITDADKAALIEGQKAIVDEKQELYDSELKSYTDAADEYPQFNAEGLKAYEALTKEDYNAKLEAEKATDFAGEKIDSDYAYMLGLLSDVEDEKKTLAGYEDGSIEMSPKATLMTTAANDIAYNYRFNPDVTSGPYKFVEFGNGMAKVTINDKFVGNAEGKKPVIKNVVVQTTNSKLDVDLVIAGTIDYVPGTIEGAKIDKAKANADKVSTNSFPRNGYGLMPILTDLGATQHKGVRQAMAYSLDRNEFVQTIAGGYGTVVNGAFGVNQFEYLEKGAEFNEKAINYTKNADMANAALDTTPYLYEADGTTPWDPAKAEEQYNGNKDTFNYWRHDAEGNALTVIHEGTAELNVSELISAQLPDNAKLAGMQYIFKPVDFATMLNHYYSPNVNDKEAPTVFNMGNGFAIPNDPYYAYHSSQIGTGDNRQRVNDPELDKILETMRNVTPDNKEAWLDGWLAFQLWYNENMPAVPLYANEYYDVFTNRVQGVHTTPMHDWSDIICDLSLAQ